MRNLVLTRQWQGRIELEPGECMHSFCVDPDTGSVFAATSAGAVCRLAADLRVDWRVDLNSAEELSPASSPAGHAVVTLAYAVELESVCIGTADGALVLVSADGAAVEQVGSVEGGVAAAAWSPGGDALLVVTGHGVLLLMNQDFEVLAESDLGDDSGSGQQLSVATACVTWRGDGDYVATLVEPAATDQPGSDAVATRQHASLRVWDGRTLQPHAEGEAAAALSAVAAWQPNGRHLYAAQHAGSTPRVVLFERNGLQHGGFDVPVPGRISGLCWSADSELLAVTLEQDDRRLLQLWQRRNWHWYLKKERRFGLKQGALHIHWDEASPALLRVCTASGLFTQMHFGQHPAVSRRGTVAVVDGDKLLLTPLRHVVVPPPMAAVTAHTSAPVDRVAFCDSADVEKVAIVLADGAVELLNSVEDDLWEETAEDIGLMGPGGPELTAATSSFQLPGPVQDVVWLGSNALLVVHAAGFQADNPGTTSAGEWLQEIREDGSGDAVQVSAPVLTLTSDPFSCQPAAALVQLKDGSVLRYQAGAGLCTLPGWACLRSPCQQVAATPDAALQAAGSIPPLVGLADNGQLLWGQQLIAIDVTSFVVRSDGAGGPFLLYTTRQDVMYTVPFARLAAYAGALPPAEATAGGAFPRNRGVGAGKQDNHYTAMHAAMRPTAAHAAASSVVARAVEAGARLLAAPPDDVRVIMQLPRGNLETVAPRALVLAAIADSLQARNYSIAWQLAAANRVDLNALVDFAYPAVLDDVEAFVAAAPSTSDLCDLLAALAPVSVTRPGGLYAEMQLSAAASQAADVRTPEPADAAPEDKVAAVCAALRAAMQAAGQRRYLGPILTSHAKQGDLEAALATVQQLKEEELSASQAQRQQQTAIQPATADGAPSANGIPGRTNGHPDGHAAAAPGDTSAAGGDSAADVSPAEPGGSAAVDAEDGAASVPDVHKSWTAEDGLRHLLLYSDVNKLYRAALGMYELPLAYMVIAHSQRDPGEYLLELQGFAAKPSQPLRRHAIDAHLGRWPQALRHLVAAGDEHFNAALGLAEDKGLLRELLSLCPADRADWRATVLHAIGSSLTKRSMHEDAAVAFVAAGDLREALHSYRAGGHWRMVMALAGRLQYSEAEVQRLAVDLVEELTSLGHPGDAAHVAATYLADADNAVLLFAQSRQWREAFRVAYQFRRDDLVDTVIGPVAAEAAAGGLTDIEDDAARVAKYLQRYQDVQRHRLSMQAALAEAGELAGPSPERDVDEASEAGSMVSGMSAYTTASTATGSTVTGSGRPASTVGGRKPHKQKNRQKVSKGARIRHGSPEEEAALAAHISALAPSPAALAALGELSEALVVLGHADDARVLQAAMAALLAAQEEATVYLQQHPWPQDPANLRIAKAGERGVPSSSTTTWKWDVLRPARFDSVDR